MTKLVFSECAKTRVFDLCNWEGEGWREEAVKGDEGQGEGGGVGEGMTKGGTHLMFGVT